MELDKARTMYDVFTRRNEWIDLYEAESRKLIGETLYTKLTKIKGVSDVCYDSQFKDMITITIESPLDDDAGTRKKVLSVLRKHLKECRECCLRKPSITEGELKKTPVKIPQLAILYPPSKTVH
jgi:hypothetical protein